MRGRKDSSRGPRTTCRVRLDKTAKLPWGITAAATTVKKSKFFFIKRRKKLPDGKQQFYRTSDSPLSHGPREIVGRWRKGSSHENTGVAFRVSVQTEGTRAVVLLASRSQRIRINCTVWRRKVADRVSKVSSLSIDFVLFLFESERFDRGAICKMYLKLTDPVRQRKNDRGINCNFSNPTLRQLDRPLFLANANIVAQTPGIYVNRPTRRCTPEQRYSIVFGVATIASFFTVLRPFCD